MKLDVSQDWHKSRLDHFVTHHCPDISRSYLKKLIKQGHILLNQQAQSKSGVTLKTGDQIEIDIPPVQSLEIEAEDIPLDIVFEDEHLLVINKPADFVVHPGPGHSSGTLVNALLHHCDNLSGIGGVERPGIIHRLDKDTTGLMMVAKHDQSHQHLTQQLQTRTLKRHYYALVENNFREESGTVSAPMARHPKDRKRMAVVPGGKEAITHWRVVEQFREYSYLSLQLQTGRTHQIRVHMQHLQHSIIGDLVYGSRKKFPMTLTRQMLHAYQIGFIHPESEEEMTFKIELPEDFQKALDYLGKSFS